MIDANSTNTVIDQRSCRGLLALAKPMAENANARFASRLAEAMQNDYFEYKQNNPDGRL